MSTARKYAANSRAMSPQSRHAAYAAINITWQQMRPDLKFEAKEIVREEMLAWCASFLALKKLDSIKDLSDGQIGRVLDEMKRMTGQQPQPKPDQKSPFTSRCGKLRAVEPPGTGAEIIHLTSEEQLFTLQKLETFIGWTAERRENYLQPRFQRKNFQMLTFKQANTLMMQMLNIAAHKDLKAQGKPTGRAATAKHIKIIKKKLQIGD